MEKFTEMKEFETAKSLVDFMEESIKSSTLYEGGAIFQGEYIECMVDSPEETKYSFQEADCGPHVNFCVTEGNLAYIVQIPAAKQWVIEEYLERL